MAGRGAHVDMEAATGSESQDVFDVQEVNDNAVSMQKDIDSLELEQLQVQKQLKENNLEKLKGELLKVKSVPNFLQSRQGRNPDDVLPRLQSLRMDTDSDDEESQMDQGNFERKKLQKKSGLFLRATDKVLIVQEWPRLNVRREYSTASLAFQDLSLPLFVAGELEIVLSFTNKVEREERIRFLRDLMYYASKFEFKVLLDWYAAVMRELELGKIC